MSQPKHFRALYDELWQRGKAFVRSHEGVPILEDFVARRAHREVILVRDEYPRIWEHIRSRRSAAVDAGQMDQESLIINGQPGIGKSLFLYYALGAALQARIPVVLCQNKRYCGIFDVTGYTEFCFDRGEPFDVPDHALFLVDCGRELSSPPTLFLECSGVLVVTGPRIHETGWGSMNASGRTLFWMMDVWTRAEMHALQRTFEALTTPCWVNPPHGEAGVYTPVELLDLLGPSPRQCLHYAGRTPKTPAGPTEDLRSSARPGCMWVLDNLDTVLGPRAGTPRRANRALPRSLFLQDNLDGVLALVKRKRGGGAETETPATNANPSCTPPEFHYVVPTLFLRQMLTDMLFQFVMLIPWRTPRTLKIATAARARSPAFAAATFYQPLLIRYLLETRAGRVCHLVFDDDNDDDEDSRRALSQSKFAFDAPPTFCLGPGLALRHQAVELEAGSESRGFQSDSCAASLASALGLADHDGGNNGGGGGGDEVGEDEDEEDEDEEESESESGYILTPSAGFTAFDVVVVSERRTRVTLLRAAVGPDARLLDLDAEREAIRGAIAAFDRVLPDPEAVRWCFVYAALDGERARRLAENERARRTLEGVDPRLRVGWTKVGSRNERRRAVLHALEGPGETECWEESTSEEESEEERPAKRSRRG
ncbi:hypothetical protein GSI_08712 [Ganoderma sinense ZZ0214-1]|uniref:Uncharacterized protein n=1 Tax=Ganoderma sinense ZZ0214-1 TaxID=1077348 RepID=A0A2G8S532_9APHY|nr:hypothetical protein GSI_08712 [Ganoderma sinense ZZ0214-1]